jgi:hypothetical protein
VKCDTGHACVAREYKTENEILKTSGMTLMSVDGLSIGLQDTKRNEN